MSRMRARGVSFVVSLLLLFSPMIFPPVLPAGSAAGKHALAPDTREGVREAHITVLLRSLLGKVGRGQIPNALEWSRFWRAAIEYLRETPTLNVYLDPSGSIVLHDPRDEQGTIYRFLAVDSPAAGPGDPLGGILKKLTPLADNLLTDQYRVVSYQKRPSPEQVPSLKASLRLMLPGMNTLNPRALAFRSREEFMDYLEGFFANVPPVEVRPGETQEKAYKRVADEVNAYPHALKGGATEKLGTAEFLGEWMDRAEKMYLDGEIVNHVLWVGAATRATEILGGGSKALFNPVLDVLSRAQEYLDSIAPDENFPLQGLLSNPDAQVRLPVALGPRQIIQYRIELERLAGKHGRDMQQVLANQRFIVAVNDKTRDIIVSEFRKADFFGFDPDNIVFTEQPTFPAFRVEKGRWIAVEGSAFPFGHGHTKMQTVLPRMGFTVDRAGERTALEESPLGYLKERAGGGRLLSNNWNIDDLVRLGGSLREMHLCNLDVRRAAMALKLIVGEGNHVVVETVVNEKGQKGGGWFEPGMLVEGLQLQTGPNVTVDFKKVDLNRMGNWEDVDALLSRLPLEGLPLYLVPKKFEGRDVMILESITGDETRTTGIRPKAFSERGVAILTFKKVVDTVGTMARMKIQDEDPEFVAMAARIYPGLLPSPPVPPGAPKDLFQRAFAAVSALMAADLPLIEKSSPLRPLTPPAAPEKVQVRLGSLAQQADEIVKKSAEVTAQLEIGIAQADRLQKMTIELSTLQKVAEGFNQQLDAVQKGLQRLGSEVERALASGQKISDAAVGQLNAQKQQIDGTIRNVEATRTQIAEGIRHLEVKKREKEKALADARTELNKQRVALGKKVEETKKVLEDVERTKGDLAAREKEQQEASARLNEALERIISQTNEITRLSSQLVALEPAAKNAAEVRQTLEGRLQGLRDQISGDEARAQELRQSIVSMDTEIAGIKKQYEEGVGGLQGTMRELAGVQSSLAELGSQVVSLGERLQAISGKELETVQGAVKEVEGLAGSIAQAQKQRETLQQTMREMRQTQAREESNLVQLVLEASSAQKDLSEAISKRLEELTAAIRTKDNAQREFVAVSVRIGEMLGAKDALGEARSALERQIASAQAQGPLRDEEITRLNKDLGDLTEQIAEKDRQIKELEMGKNAAQTALDKKNDELGKGEIDLKRLDAQANRLQWEMERLDEKVTGGLARVTALEATHKRLEQAKVSTGDAIRLLKGDIDQTKTQIATLLPELEESRRMLAGEEENKARIVAEIEEKARLSTQEAKTAIQRNQEVLDQRDEARAYLARLEEMRNQLQGELEKITEDTEGLEGQVAELSEQKKAGGEEVRGLEKDLANLIKELRKQDRLKREKQSDIDELEEKLRDVTVQIGELDIRSGAFFVTLETIRAALTKMRSLKTLVEKKEMVDQTLRLLDQQIGQWRKAVQIAETERKQGRMELEKNQRKVDQERDRLKKDLDEISARIAHRRGQKEAMERRLADLSAESDGLSETNRRLEGRLGELETLARSKALKDIGITLTARQIAMLKQEIEKNKNLAKEKQRQVDVAQRDLQKASEELQSEGAVLKSVQHHLKKLTRDIVSLQKGVQRSLRALAIAQEQKKEMERGLLVAQAQATSAGDELARVQGERAMVQKGLDETREALTQQRTTNERLKGDLEDVNRQLDAAREEEGRLAAPAGPPAPVPSRVLPYSQEQMDTIAEETILRLALMSDFISIVELLDWPGIENHIRYWLRFDAGEPVVTLATIAKYASRLKAILQASKYIDSIPNLGIPLDDLERALQFFFKKPLPAQPAERHTVLLEMAQRVESQRARIQNLALEYQRYIEKTEGSVLRRIEPQEGILYSIQPIKEGDTISQVGFYYSDPMVLYLTREFRDVRLVIEKEGDNYFLRYVSPEGGFRSAAIGMANPLLWERDPGTNQVVFTEDWKSLTAEGLAQLMDAKRGLLLVEDRQSQRGIRISKETPAQKEGRLRAQRSALEKALVSAIPPAEITPAVQVPPERAVEKPPAIEEELAMPPLPDLKGYKAIRKSSGLVGVVEMFGDDGTGRIELGVRMEMPGVDPHLAPIKDLYLDEAYFSLVVTPEGKPAPQEAYLAGVNYEAAAKDVVQRKQEKRRGKAEPVTNVIETARRFLQDTPEALRLRAASNSVENYIKGEPDYILDSARNEILQGLTSEVERKLPEALTLEGDREREEQYIHMMQEIEGMLLLLPLVIGEDSRRMYRSSLDEALKSRNPRMLQKWFNGFTALGACRHIPGTAAWKMPDGTFMNAGQHNAELFKVYGELAAGDKEAFYRRHERSFPADPAQRAAYESAIYGKFKEDYDLVAADRDSLEILYVASNPHDYGKTLRGNHPWDSARLVAPLLQALGYDPESKKYKWILLLIKRHTSLGGDLFYGEGSPSRLSDEMTVNGITEHADREKFLRLLSLLTFADIGSVATGRYVPENLAQMRLAAEWIAQSHQPFFSEWPQLRFIALYGGIALPSDRDLRAPGALRSHVQSMYQNPDTRASLEPVEDGISKISLAFLFDMEFLYARYLFGPPKGGGTPNMTSANTMKCMVLADRLWRTTERTFQLVHFASDREEHARALNEVLNGLTLEQIEAFVREQGDQVKADLSAGQPVEVLGIPIRLSADRKTLLVDTKGIRPAVLPVPPAPVPALPVLLPPAPRAAKILAEGQDNEFSLELPAGAAISARTDRGIVRKDNANQDAVAVVTGGKEPLMLAVADGMGGLEEGRVASWIAATAVAAEEPLERLLSTIDENIKNAIVADPQRRRIGTTFAVAQIEGDVLKTRHVGDCRVYVWQRIGDKVKLTHLTKDHSEAQQLIESHPWAPGEPKDDTTYMGKNKIINPLNGVLKSDKYSPLNERIVRVADSVLTVEGRFASTGSVTHQVELPDGAIVLLCSDGLHGMVTLEEMTAILNVKLPEGPGAMQRALVKAALDKGGKDNVSVVVYQHVRPVPRKVGPIDWRQALPQVVESAP